jgi:hypothetical protein
MVRSLLRGAGIAALVLLAGCTTVSNTWNKVWSGAVALDGAQEVPAVKTTATGSAAIDIKEDRTVSGKVTVTGFTPTAAHIHLGAAGKNGAVIVTLKKVSDTEFVVPTEARLNDKQYQEFKAGNLYVNVHSAAHPGGEIRAQLKP